MIGSITPEIPNENLLNSLVNTPELIKKENSATSNVELNHQEVNVALEAV